VLGTRSFNCDRQPQAFKSWFNTETDRWDGYLANTNNKPATALQTARSELANDVTKAQLIAFPLLSKDAKQRLVTNAAKRQQQKDDTPVKALLSNYGFK
jgi:hypothetical protein